MTPTFCRFLNALLDSPKEVRFATTFSAQVKIHHTAVLRYLKELEELGWVATGMERDAPGGHGQRRRKMYRLTNFGIREARAKLDEHHERTLRRSSRSPRR